MRWLVRAMIVAAVLGSAHFATTTAAEAGGWNKGRFGNSYSRYSGKANRAYLGGGKYYVNGRIYKGSGVRHAFGAPYRIGGIPVFSGR